MAAANPSDSIGNFSAPCRASSGASRFLTAYCLLPTAYCLLPTRLRLGRVRNELVPYPFAQPFLPPHQASRVLVEDPPRDVFGLDGQKATPERAGTYSPAGPRCSIDTDCLRARHNSGTSRAA